jgi:hypothetical protein
MMLTLELNNTLEQELHDLATQRGKPVSQLLTDVTQRVVVPQH